jgi:hypothetical protein
MLNETRNILDRLGAADRAHQKEAGASLLLRGVKYACAVVLGAFLCDVVWHLDSRWRLGMLLAMVAGAVALALFSCHLAFLRRNPAEHIARFLETRDPALGSRLINLLQLDGQTKDSALEPLTRDLARQAVENYAADLRGVPIEKLGRTDEVRFQLGRAAWALAGFAVVVAVRFRIVSVELPRFADPFGDHPAYSFTRLAIVQPGPAGTNVLYDKGLVVRAKASGHQPKEVFLTSFPAGHPEQAVTVPMFDKAGAGYDQLLDNIHGELVVFAHTKDHASESKRVRIGVVLTPQLDKAFVRVAPPEYTGIKPEEKPYLFKDVQALEGSEVRFRLQSNRPLREGTLEITAGDAPAQRVALQNTSEKELAGSFTARDSGRMRFSLVDASGLPSQGDFEGALTVTHDLPPEIRITNPEEDSFVAMDFKLQAQLEASDDYGLREVRFFRGLNGVFSAPKIFGYHTITHDSRETVDFNFAELGIQPGDVVSLYAEALDNAPQPHLARSRMVRLQVISVEDYNNFLREQGDIADAEAKYSALNDDLQNLIDQQKALGDEIQKLQAQLAKAGAGQRDALIQQLDGLIARQSELNAKLNQQAARMDGFVRDNPVYDVEQDLQKLLREQAETIRQSAQTNNDAAREVAQRSSPPGGPRQLSPDLLKEFKKASDDQIARLAGTHDETEKQVVQKLDDMDQMQDLVNDFNRFESLYHAQQDLAQQAQVYNRPGQLDRADQLALKDLAAAQQQVADALGPLQDKLRADAVAAEKLFPKAAQSGRDLADQIAEHRLKPMAEQATSRMLADSGEQSFQLADRLRGEMEKMFGECQGGNCPSGNELDNYLKLQRMNPNHNFAQMSRSRKFGFGNGRGMASGMGQGEGANGSSGYAMMDGSTLNVLGNESSAGKDGKTARQSSRNGRGAGQLAGGANAQAEKSDAMKGLNPVNRQSGAVKSETVIDEYNDVVENYFKNITTKKEKP